jgi:hypothetical protein
MSFDNDFDDASLRANKGFLGTAGGSMIRVALLFGSGAVALALILTPIVEERSRDRVAFTNPGIDFTATGSVASRQSQGSYVIRRSVLQPDPEAVCIIRANGSRHGHC